VRRAAVAAAASLALALGAGTAAAHIDVLPTRVEQGQAQEFTVRVPTERELPTTGVRVDFPEQVTVYALAPPPPGWTMRERRSADGRLVGVRYTGGSIPVGGYQDFTFLGTPFEEGETVWRTYQTYADGKVKPWTAAPEGDGEVTQETGPTDPGPAAAVTVVPEGALATAAVAAAPADEDSGDDGSGAAVWVSLVAVAIAVAAFLAAAFLWTTRPMRLPEDPGEGTGR
jgi:uncharacterized protein YcnI